MKTLAPELSALMIHLAIYRAGDFDAAIQKIRGDRGHPASRYSVCPPWTAETAAWLRRRFSCWRVRLSTRQLAPAGFECAGQLGQEA